MFVTGESPTEQELIDSTGRRRVRARRRAGAPLLEPRLRAARPGRRRGRRATPYTRVRRQPDHRPARPRPDDLAAGRRRTRRATSSTSTPAPSGSSPTTELKGDRRGRAALVDGRRPRPAGRRSSRPGDDDVLAAKSVEAMWFPQVMWDPADWMLGWGLGLMLFNHEGRIYAGHGGAMAGHLAGRLRRPQDADRRARR